MNEIDILNKIIETAISHGAGMGGGFDEGEKLKQWMENYLILRGLKDIYYVDNPDWIKQRQGYSGLDLGTYLCFRKML